MDSSKLYILDESTAIMDEMIKPTVQALLVCDTVIVDSLTGKKSLIGIFTHLLARSFPCQHP